jgi:hypothetical protein
VRTSASCLLLIVVWLAACTAQPSVSPTPTEPTPDILIVENIDGPTVELFIGTEAIAVVPCPGSRTFEAGAGLPPWPWHLTVRATDGGPLNGVAEAVVDVGVLPGAWTLRIRGRGTALGIGRDGPLGPAANTCPPAPVPSS